MLELAESNGANFVSESSWFGHVLCKLVRSAVSSSGSGSPEPPKSKSLDLNVKHWANPIVCAPVFII